MELAGKVALVTGGASGIGRATALALARRGASIALIDVNGPAAREVVGVIESEGSKAVALEADVADPEAVRRSVDETLATFGRVDILVNNAGIRGEGDLLDLSLEAWDHILAVNLRSASLFTKAVGRHMVERGGGGKIVSLSSTSAFHPRANAAYAASKAGIAALTRSAALVLGPHDINVNAVAPSITVTPMVAHLNPYGAAKQGSMANMLGRPALPEDVAEVIVFLCLPTARQITGQLVHTSAGTVV